MATFYGGEQLSQVVRLEGTVSDLDIGENILIYTVPTGFYGLLKFAFIGNNTVNYPSDAALSQIVVVSKDVNINSGQESQCRICVADGSSAGGVIETFTYHKLIYRPSVSVTKTEAGAQDISDPSGCYDLYLQSGDKFYARNNTIVNNLNVRYEIEFHLYKKP